MYKGRINPFGVLSLVKLGLVVVVCSGVMTAAAN